MSALAASSLLIAAPFVGSFLGVVIRRMPADRPFGGGRSACEHCGTALSARDLIPMISWTALRGRCRHCGTALGWFYPAVEAAALAVAAVALSADPTPRVWLDCLLGWWLLVLAWIDLRCWLLPDALTLPLIVAGLVEAAVLEPADIGDRAAAAVIGYGALWVLAEIYRRLRGRDGLGHGDAKLLAAVGAWLGLAALPQTVLLSAVAALAAALALGLSGMRLSATTALPFGPFLAAAAWILWLFSPLRLA